MIIMTSDRTGTKLTDVETGDSIMLPCTSVEVSKGLKGHMVATVTFRVSHADIRDRFAAGDHTDQSDGWDEGE